MAIKLHLSPEEYSSIGDNLKGLYIEKDGKYILDAEMEDTGALKRAKEHESERRREAEKKLKELEAQLSGNKYEEDKRKGDIEALEKSWQEKHSKVTKELSDKYTRMQNAIKQNLIDSTARSIAGEISTVPSLLARVISDRLTVDFENDMPSLKVLDQAGKLSAFTVEDLKKEIYANKEFSSILIATKSSGGGASQIRSSGQNQNSEIPLSKMSPVELAAHLKASK